MQEIKKEQKAADAMYPEEEVPTARGRVRATEKPAPAATKDPRDLNGLQNKPIATIHSAIEQETT